MKGTIFNYLEQMVEESHGEEFLECLYEDAGITEDMLPFVGPVTYPDQLMMALVAALSSKTGTPSDDLLRAFGAFAFPKMALTYGRMGGTARDGKELLLRVEQEIHTEVRKLDPDASPPTLRASERPDGSVILAYSSPRMLCPFLEGLLDGLASHYGEQIEHHKLSCLRRGADACTYEVRFGNAPEAGGC